MGNRLRTITGIVVALFSWAFIVAEGAREGSLTSRVLQKRVAPLLLSVSGGMTDLKFKIRGPEDPKNKIVLIEIDEASLSALGRWPWPRETYAYMLDQIFEYEPKAVGFDIFFSEPEQKIPDTLAYELERRKLSKLIPREADGEFVKFVKFHSQKIVLGWHSNTGCIPRFPEMDGCPVTDPAALKALPKHFSKFSASMVSMHPNASAGATAIFSYPSVNPNVPELENVARHAGYVNTIPDPDGTVRVSPLIGMVGGLPYPALPLEMARVGTKDRVGVRINEDSDLEKLTFAQSQKDIRASLRGIGQIRFRGGPGTFTSISAQDLLQEKDKLDDEVYRKLANVSKKEVLRDAYVLIGVTALGLHDQRTTPFGGQVAGLEIQANVLDNILAGDLLSQGSDPVGYWVVLALMSIGMFGVVMFAQKRDAIPAVASFAIALVIVAPIDIGILFPRGHDWNTGFLYLEALTLMMLTLVAKYVTEEQKKKFIRGAFTKYLAPAIVDEIVRDPSRLSLGGKRRALTILFSDIRGFTTFSERMDARLLSEFLNDYLTIQTRLVFENRGTLDKYIGDAIMAFWGAPLESGEHAFDCCNTAVRMMKALDENRARFKEQYGVDVYIGVGINTGDVSVGNMGSESSFSYTVIGDSVNLASRLEGATKAYGVGILTTAATLDSIRESGRALPRHRVLDQVKVKGKKNSVEIVEILYRDLPDDAAYQFEKGRTLYTQQKWDEAIEAFHAANEKVVEVFGESDGPCQTYLARCEKFKAESPGPDWDGSWEFDSK